MKAILITIGDEILSGKTVDTNSAWIASHLNDLGIQVVEIISVSDEHNAIIESLQSNESADIVITTGGLGPTKDDITVDAICEYHKDTRVFNQTMFERMESMFERLGVKFTSAHRRQCHLPEKARLLENKRGTAPGLHFETNHRKIFHLPGVPYEMKYIMDHHIIPLLSEVVPHKVIHKTILTAGIEESGIAEILESKLSPIPSSVKLAYLPSLASVKIRLSCFDNSVSDEQITTIQTEISDLLSGYVYGYDDDSLESVVGRLLREKKLTLATAESCTGGLLAHQITTVPGASDYFLGSVVAYDNGVKERLLNVNEETLQSHGAVSEETAIEMVKGTIQRMKSDIGIAVTGIAGPGGGTPEKPVGTIWIACGNSEKITTKLLHLGKDRMINVRYTVTTALNMLYKFLSTQ